MIHRHQRVLFWSLNLGILIVSLVLIRGCKQAHDRLAAPTDETPISAPTSASDEPATLYLASDSDGSITVTTQNLPLPEEPTTRARILLTHLLAEYALPHSLHPIPSGPSVDDVFLLNLPLTGANLTVSRPDALPAYPSLGSGQLAIVNLHGSFADTHPSGVETENLTILSIVGTLHAALPSLTEVRFLVDGQPRETLAGHADLTRSYRATDTAIVPSIPGGARP
ncbi:MAG: GerMN domain-containing protein [Acidobacteriaceae bacterium]